MMMTILSLSIITTLYLHTIIVDLDELLKPKLLPRSLFPFNFYSIRPRVNFLSFVKERKNGKITRGQSFDDQ